MPKQEDVCRTRKVLAREAARIIADQGIENYRQAKVKAAERLGFRDRGALPSNAEIETALIEHHRLFGASDHSELLDTLRRVALDVMHRLAEFRPRLVGPVLAGTAASHSAINLHLFSDAAEDVAFRLDGEQTPYQLYERRLKSRQDRLDTYPGYRFRCGEAVVEATVFPEKGLRQAPISPVDGKPMRRADTRALERLLAEAPSPIF
ncbi:MAG: hypothetical protein P8172_15490 [Gammaproteobacteria bacterium]|jgi:hypothetical protein